MPRSKDRCFSERERWEQYSDWIDHQAPIPNKAKTSFLFSTAGALEEISVPDLSAKKDCRSRASKPWTVREYLSLGPMTDRGE